MANEVARFWSKVSKGSPDECWLWTGAKGNSSGHGVFWAEGRNRGAHVYSWMLANAAIPKLSILHRCGRPACVNPNHLYEGNARDNALDSVAHGTNFRAKRTKCENGHPWTRETAGRVYGYRRCLVCHRQRQRKYREERRGSK